MSVNYISSSACFSRGLEEDNGKFYKKALILAEGEWKDNKQISHEFTADRLKQIAKNTNSFFQAGNPIPLIKDHQKTTDSVIGELDDCVEVRPITENDITSPRHGHLIGRLGIFASKVLIQSRDAIQKIQENLIKYISPGIDVVENCIKEISATPIPAIAGMSLFARSNPLHWDEEPSSELDFKDFVEDFNEDCDHFLNVLQNIYQASELEISETGCTRSDLIKKLVGKFFISTLESLDLSDTSSEEEEDVIVGLVESMCNIQNFI